MITMNFFVKAFLVFFDYTYGLENTPKIIVILKKAYKNVTFIRT